MPGTNKGRKTVNRTVPDRSWTIMVYMVPDAILRGPAVSSLGDMMSARPKKHFDVVVQQDDESSEKPARMRVKGDILSNLRVSGARTNPGSPQVLFGFLRDVTERFPASHYMLVLWGHALGFNFGHASDPTTALELNQVLKKFSALRGRPLDILGCDTCRMSKIELAALLQGSVDLIVASETGTPLTSWPYEPILNAVSSKPDLSPKEFGRAIIDNYCARYRPVGVSLTMLDLKHGLPVFDAVEELGMALLKAIADSVELEKLFVAIKKTSRDTVEPMIDLQEFCKILGKSTSNASVRTVTGNVLQLLAPPFIAKQGRKGPGVSHFRGVGIYVPRVLYAPAFRNKQVRKFFKLKQETVPFATTAWTKVVDRLIAASRQEGALNIT